MVRTDWIDLVEYWCLVCILMICFFPMEFPKALLQGHYVLCTIPMLSAEYYVIMEWNIIYMPMTFRFIWLLTQVFLVMFNVLFLNSLGVLLTFNIGWLKTNSSLMVRRQRFSLRPPPSTWKGWAMSVFILTLLRFSHPRLSETLGLFSIIRYACQITSPNYASQ